MIRSLTRSQVTGLPFVYSDLGEEIMATVNIRKYIPPSLEVSKVEDASSSLVVRTSKSSDLYKELSNMFGKESLHSRKPRKRIMVATTSSVRTGKAPLLHNGYEKTGDPNAAGNLMGYLL